MWKTINIKWRRPNVTPTFLVVYLDLVIEVVKDSILEGVLCVIDQDSTYAILLQSLGFHRRKDSLEHIKAEHCKRLAPPIGCRFRFYWLQGVLLKFRQARATMRLSHRWRTDIKLAMLGMTVSFRKISVWSSKFLSENSSVICK